MALTSFTDGVSTVSAAFLEAIFKTGGGHRHNGGGNDGEANKIDLPTEVDWGTNGFITKIQDNVARVQWRLQNSGGGTFGLTLDNLFNINHISTDAGTLHLGSAPGVSNQHLACTDITALGNVDAVDGDFSGNVDAVDVTATGNILGNQVSAPNIIATTGTFTPDLTLDSVDIKLLLPSVSTTFSAGTGSRTLERDVWGNVDTVTGSAAGAAYTLVLDSPVTSTMSKVIVSFNNDAGDESLFWNISWTDTSTLVIRFNKDDGSEEPPTNYVHVDIWDI